MAVISNATTIADAGAFSINLGSMVLIKTLTLSNAANASFVDGASSVVLDNTYSTYIFKFINMHPVTDTANFLVNFRDGGSAFDATKTSTAFRSLHNEADTETSLAYQPASDLAQGTGYQLISQYVGNGNDESCSGELTLFSPSSTTSVKNYICKSNSYYANDKSNVDFIGGYCNVTAAIDGVDFKFASGNIDSGVIKMYGLAN